MTEAPFRGFLSLFGFGRCGSALAGGLELPHHRGVGEALAGGPPHRDRSHHGEGVLADDGEQRHGHPHLAEALFHDAEPHSLLGALDDAAVAEILEAPRLLVLGDGAVEVGLDRLVEVGEEGGGAFDLVRAVGVVLASVDHDAGDTVSSGLGGLGSGAGVLVHGVHQPSFYNQTNLVHEGTQVID